MKAVKGSLNHMNAASITEYVIVGYLLFVFGVVGAKIVERKLNSFFLASPAEASEAHKGG
jgi:hypothetical protein